jgi:cell division protein FtsL
MFIVNKIIKFRYWFISVVAVLIFVPSMAYQQLRSVDKYKHHYADYCAAHFAAKSDQVACIEERANADEYLDWRYSLFSFPSGITAWAIILTGFAIVWQSSETRKAAEAAQQSVDLAAAANTQWTELKLVDIYSSASKGHAVIPETLTLRCRWAIENPSSAPLTLHNVVVSVSRDDAWHVSEFHFEEIVSPKSNEIFIVPIPLNAIETTDYLSNGVEYPVSIQAAFTGVNGRIATQKWGDLYFFCKGTAEHNASLGKGPKREYKEEYEDEGTMRESEEELFEMPKSADPHHTLPKQDGGWGVLTPTQSFPAAWT